MSGFPTRKAAKAYYDRFAPYRNDQDKRFVKDQGRWYIETLIGDWTPRWYRWPVGESN